MGMFDNVIVNTDMLPVTDEEKKIIGKNPNWQTKSFDCEMTEIHITDEGELKVCKWEFEKVPLEERLYPNDEGIFGLIGSLRRKNERLEKMNYHGVFNFYSQIGENWYDFFAKFTDGKLQSIEGGKENKNTIM